MPAVNADPLTLPRLSALGPDVRRRAVAKVVDSFHTLEGEGFAVRRPFPNAWLDMLDPFVLLDHMGSVDYGPGEAKGTPWHPHRGFETVTYIMDGAFAHQDSTGGGGLIADGATQWMTAGSGIFHIEQPPEALVAKGGRFHGVQLWVNLPSRQKWVAPRYQDIKAGQLTLLASSDGGTLVRVIAGEVAGHSGPGVTYTPITYLHATIAPDAQLELPWPEDFSAAVYALVGRGYAGEDQRPVEEGQLALFGRGGAITLRAAAAQRESAAKGWEVLILGGLPIGEPVARYGPFVMNTESEIRDTIDDFRHGRLVRAEHVDSLSPTNP
ncbi:MAG: pirin family protein [Acidimicrobiales bacterium]